MRMVFPNDPVKFFGDLVGDMNQIADSLVQEGRCANGLSSEKGYSPRLDVIERDNAFLFQFDLPGVNPDDVTIDLDNDELRIEGKREHAGSEDNQKWIVRERGNGEFRRVFRIPDGVDQDAVEASYENGVLTLVLPKIDKPEAKRVPIKVN